MYLFIIGDFFRRRQWRRADDEMPAAPLLEMLLFWVLFGAAVLLGSLAVTDALIDAYAAATVWGIATAASLAGAVVFWRRLNR